MTDLPNYQVQVLRRWNDGSVKHAIVSGRAALTQNVAKTVTVSIGTPPTGAAMTAATIQAAAPTATVQCGSLGSVSLANLIGSPFRTFISGPEMVECHYRGALSGTDIAVWFHVRRFADGRMWIRAIVENGYLDNGSGGLASETTRSYVPTITIGGVTVFSNGGATLNHHANTRYMAVGWIGGDPQVTAIVDVAYLRSSRLVPNWSTAPASTVYSGFTQTYVPMDNGDITQSMGDTGYQPMIGLLPNWNAAFVASGDARALRATLANSSHLNSYSIGWRAKNTNLPIRPSDFATWTVEGPGGGGVGTPGMLRGSLYWESAHHPGEGYLAYLLTGDYWHYETMALNCAMCYLGTPSARGSGTSRFLTLAQTRSVAWMMRTLGIYAALAPDTDLATGQVAADYRTMLANMYTNLQARITGGESMVYTGNLYQSEYSTSGNWGTDGAIAPWQSDFLVATHGFLSDIEPLASSTALIAVRDWMYRWPVGRLGRSGTSSEYSFTQAAQYGLEVATPPGNNNNWYQTWGAIYQAETGSANTTVSNTLSGGNFPNMDSYWANLQPAIAYAVDHGAAGAAAGYARMTGASNWSSLFANFPQIPVWAVRPRQ